MAMNAAHPNLSVRATIGEHGTLLVELRGEADLATHQHLVASLSRIPWTATESCSSGFLN